MTALSTFLSTPSDKPKLLVIYGPTACGKTTLTVELAKQCNGEVISADSRQIYRGMNIGTGKITSEEMQGIPHYMLDIRDITESYSVGEYVPEAKKIIADIIARGKLPILSGGTGLFIDAIIGNFDLGRAEPDWEYRAELEKIRETDGEQKLWDMLVAIDPEYAAELDARNYRYVMRAIEVFRATGKSKKSENRLGEGEYDTFFVTPFDGDRPALYERINERVLGMFEQGLIEEVSQLMQNAKCKIQNEGGTLSLLGILEKLPGLNAIGYREILPYLTGEQSLERTIELVQQNSRHYAKRQLTWFRRYTTHAIDGFFGA